MTRPEVTQCAECGKSIPLHSGYVSWCECGWNLHSNEVDTLAKPLIHYRFSQKLNEKHGQKLFDKMIKGGVRRPTLSLAGVLFLLLSLAILSINLGLFSLSLICLLKAKWNFLLIFLGLSGFLLAWLTRPRIIDAPDSVLTNEAYPALYKLVQDVADQFGIREDIKIILSKEFNASMSRRGLKQVRVLEIGLPLFLSLDKQEKVALIGHELAHLDNGDLWRLLLGSGFNTLSTWIWLLHTDELWPTYYDDLFEGISQLLSNLFRSIITHILRSIHALMILLSWGTHQRAEYYADIRGALIAGKSHSVTSLEKLLMVATLELSKQRATVADDDQDLIGNFVRATKDVPQRERERIALQDEETASSIDYVHPPTSFRIKVIKTLSESEPLVTLSRDEEKVIEEELRSAKEGFNVELADDYRQSLYDYDQIDSRDYY